MVLLPDEDIGRSVLAVGHASEVRDPVVVELVRQFFLHSWTPGLKKRPVLQWKRG